MALDITELSKCPLAVQALKELIKAACLFVFDVVPSVVSPYVDVATPHVFDLSIMACVFHFEDVLLSWTIFFFLEITFVAVRGIRA